MTSCGLFIFFFELCQNQSWLYYVVFHFNIDQFRLAPLFFVKILKLANIISVNPFLTTIFNQGKRGAITFHTTTFRPVNPRDLKFPLNGRSQAPAVASHGYTVLTYRTPCLSGLLKEQVQSHFYKEFKFKPQDKLFIR